MKKLFNILLITFILLLLPVASKASCSIIIDGKELVCTDTLGNEVPPFVENGTTYVPVRAIATAFSTTVEWEQETMTVYIGTKSGTPVLNENINIFSNGSQFVCYDVLGNSVHPILRDGTTYLPIRGIGTLFNKKIIWDNYSRSAILLSPVTNEAMSYIENSVLNTSRVENLSSSVSVSGSIYYDTNLLGTAEAESTDPYSPSGLSLSSILDDNFKTSAAYLGEGKYFLTASAEKFLDCDYVQKTLFKRESSVEASTLFVYISTQGGYVTDFDIYLSSNLLYKETSFRQDIHIKSTILYPESFSFPSIPCPSDEPNENFVPAEADSLSDAMMISAFSQNLVKLIRAKDATSVTRLLHPNTYQSIYGNKSKTQLASEITAINNRISSIYAGCTGEFKAIKTSYTTPPASFPLPERAVKVSLLLSSPEGDKELDFTALKIEGKWYLSPTSIPSN